NVQQRRLSRTRRRDQSDRLARPQPEPRAVENGQRRLALHILTPDVVKIDNRYVCCPLLHLSPHSYRSASTGSRRAARHDGQRVARKDSVSAITTTAVVSPASISAGRRERRY